MFPITYSDRQYVVPLDSLDLVFLKQYIENSNDKPKLLWSKSALDGESDYCEVEFVAEDVDDDISYIESSESIMCHICNIDVPQIYFKLHVKSLRHQNYKRLTEKILENVSKQINIEVEHTDTNNLIDKFYCETCSKVVFVKNKQKHNQSAHHLKFQEYARQIDVFLKIYIEDNTIQIQNNIDSTDLEYESYSDSSEELYNETEDDHFKNIIPVNNSVSGSCTDNNIQHNMKEVNLKQSLQSINLDNTIVIETPKGYKKKVKVKNYHGYLDINNTFFCQLCNRWLDNDMQEHFNSDGHLENVKQPIDDEFVRDLIRMKMKHCVLCNLVIRPDSDHTANVNHQNYLSIDFENNNVKKNIPSKTFCPHCNRHIDAHNFKAHTLTKKHKNLAAKNKKISHGPKVAVTADTATISESTVQDTKSHCNICKIDVPSGSMPNHETELSHVMAKVFVEYLDCNSPVIPSENKFKQAPSTAKATIPKIKKSLALSIPEKLIEYKKQMTELSATVMKCLICDLNVPNTDNNIIEHVDGINHNNVLNLNKLTKIAPRLYYCDLCKLNIRHLAKHVSANSIHIRNKILQNQVNKDKLIEYVYTDPTNASATAVAYREIYNQLLKNQKITVLENSYFYCSVCSVRMTRVSEITHMLGERHASCLKAQSL